jgi:hypothetical protein
VILEARKHHPESEEVILALVKLEREKNNFLNAKQILAEARESCNSARVSVYLILDFYASCSARKGAK